MSKMILSDYTVHEILEKVAAHKETAAKINYMKFLDKAPLREFFDIIYDQNIKFSFKIPKFKEDDARRNNVHTSLKSKLKLVRQLADDGRYGNLAEEKRAQIAMDLIDSLENDEARLLTDLFRKQFKFKGITKPIIKAVYPDLKENIES